MNICFEIGGAAVQLKGALTDVDLFLGWTLGTGRRFVPRLKLSPMMLVIRAQVLAPILHIAGLDVQVLPGYFKYGWSAPIQRYAHSEQETRQVAETAAAAAARALEVTTALALMLVAPCCSATAQYPTSASSTLPRDVIQDDSSEQEIVRSHASFKAPAR